MLLAEDNPVNQEVTRAMLASFGLEATIAGNGAEAPRRFRAGVSTSCWMDCQMPGRDGYEATRRLRALEPPGGDAGRTGTAPTVPVIALTAHAMQGDREICLAAGMDDYLTKPFSAAELKRILEKWLGAAASADAPPQHAPRGGRLDPSALEDLRELERAGAEGLLSRIVRTYIADSRQRLDAWRRRWIPRTRNGSGRPPTP